MGCPRDVSQSMWWSELGGGMGSVQEVGSSVLDLLRARCPLTSSGDAKQAVRSMSLGFRVKAQPEIKTPALAHRRNLKPGD